MTPLRINETPYHHAHGVTVSLAVSSGEGFTPTVYQVDVAAWARVVSSNDMLITPLHSAASPDLDSITEDYYTLVEFYGASHAFTDQEISERTNGKFD